ncbi:DUF3999 domain-containing protein [Pragia fontium]|uniref:DUF3999 domain-containing protein n=1 Tax=Pragia fontium TaxID=82985 RepID=UPI00064A1DA1|nr:DUF3999 domain-containing protein [Pragia fontium]AKJ43205.1 hypothetical protein QQ39_14970 [Pragia fontium]
MMWLKDIRNSTFNSGAALGLLCLFSLSPVYAESPELTPQDFYHGAELETTEAFPFYRVTLPEEVYRESVKPDLSDMRVFNSSGQAVTFSLSPVEQSSVEMRESPLRIFPLKMSVDKPDGSYQGERITLKSADGVEIKISQDEKSELATSYLLQVEGEQENQNLNQIVLNWAQSKHNWQAHVTVFSSLDLKSWHKQADNAPLMDLASGSDRLLLNHIDIDDNYNSKRARYWLLVINSDGQSSAPIITKANSIAIIRDQRTETVDLPFNAKAVSKIEVEYVLDRPQPLTTLSIVPEQKNTVLPISIEYRTSHDDQWHWLMNTVVYQLDGETGYRVSEPLSLNQKLVQGIRIKAINGNWGEQPPTMTGTRNQIDVIFNAQGSSPYLLAWGSHQAPAATMTIEQLIPASAIPKSGLNDLPRAHVGSVIVLGGEQRLTAMSSAEQASQWQKWLLWGLLIVGVFGLALIVVKLAREVMGSRPQ